MTHTTTSPVQDTLEGVRASMRKLTSYVRRHQSPITPDELQAALEPFEFHPEVTFEGGSVSIWLPELKVYGAGATYEDAKADLLADIRDAVNAFRAHRDRYLAAPNRRSQIPYVIKAMLADHRGELGDVVFACPAEHGGGTLSSLAPANA